MLSTLLPCIYASIHFRMPAVGFPGKSTIRNCQFTTEVNHHAYAVQTIQQKYFGMHACNNYIQTWNYKTGTFFATQVFQFVNGVKNVEKNTLISVDIAVAYIPFDYFADQLDTLNVPSTLGKAYQLI